MHQVVSHMFVWQGGSEIFVDLIREFNRNFKTGWTEGGGDPSRIRVVETPEGLHAGPIIDTMLGGGVGGDAQPAIDDWLKDRLQQ